jgi:hypothetical protein
MTTAQVLQKLLEMYRAAPNLPSEEVEPIRQAVVELMSKWIELMPSDFESNKDMAAFLEFCACLSPENSIFLQTLLTNTVRLHTARALVPNRLQNHQLMLYRMYLDF